MTFDELKQEMSRAAKCSKFSLEIYRTNKTNRLAFENLNRDLVGAKLALAENEIIVITQQNKLTEKDSTIALQKKEITQLKKENLVLNQTKATIEKLENQIGDPLIDKTALSNLKPDTRAIITSVNRNDLDAVQSAYLNYPIKDDRVYLVNGILVKPEKPASNTALKGQIFKGPIKNRIRIRTDLEIIPESQDSEASYNTMVIVEADKTILKNKDNPPSGLKKTFRAVKNYLKANF